MFQGIRNVLLQFCVTSLLGATSCTGDRLVESCKSVPIRAIFDNLTHGIVGGFSWILVLLLSKKPLTPNIYSIVYSVVISSFIDLDHFVAAKSWNLRVRIFFSYYTCIKKNCMCLPVKFLRVLPGLFCVNHAICYVQNRHVR